MRMCFCTRARSSWLLVGWVGICICCRQFCQRFCKCGVRFCQRGKCLNERFCGSRQHT